MWNIKNTHSIPFVWVVFCWCFSPHKRSNVSSMFQIRNNQLHFVWKTSPFEPVRKRGMKVKSTAALARHGKVGWYVWGWKFPRTWQDVWDTTKLQSIKSPWKFVSWKFKYSSSKDPTAKCNSCRPRSCVPSGSTIELYLLPTCQVSHAEVI